MHGANTNLRAPHPPPLPLLCTLLPATFIMSHDNTAVIFEKKKKKNENLKKIFSFTD